MAKYAVPIAMFVVVLGLAGWIGLRIGVTAPLILGYAMALVVGLGMWAAILVDDKRSRVHRIGFDDVDLYLDRTRGLLTYRLQDVLYLKDIGGGPAFVHVPSGRRQQLDGTVPQEFSEALEERVRGTVEGKAPLPHDVPSSRKGARWPSSAVLLTLGIGAFYVSLIVYMGSRFGFPNWPLVATLAGVAFAAVAAVLRIHER